MQVSPVTGRYRVLISAASLIVGPLLMTIGDLLHPAERMDTAEQVAIVMNDSARWYAAHLLLFVGMLLAVPGLLALTGVTADRRPATGYAARVLVLIGAAALTPIFVAEMLIGRLVSNGASAAVAADVLNAMFSGPIASAVMPSVFAFFVGIALISIALMSAGGKWRWVALCYASGGLLILAEILSAQVILSQIGNALILCGGTLVAWMLVRREAQES